MLQLTATDAQNFDEPGQATGSEAGTTDSVKSMWCEKCLRKDCGFDKLAVVTQLVSGGLMPPARSPGILMRVSLPLLRCRALINVFQSFDVILAEVTACWTSINRAGFLPLLAIRCTLPIGTYTARFRVPRGLGRRPSLRQCHAPQPVVAMLCTTEYRRG
jgi:hypothetical protein